MADLTNILADNLKETFRAIEKFLLIGLTSSLVLVVLAITDHGLTGEQKVMLADINAPAFLVAAVALATYFASGAFAALHFFGRRRIVKLLDERDPMVVDALLTYPSVVSRIGPPQVVALFCVGGSGMLALALFYVPTHEMQKAFFAFAVIGSPYILLFAMALFTVIEERPRRS
jgi:hypothetical protein